MRVAWLVPLLVASSFATAHPSGEQVTGTAYTLADAAPPPADAAPASDTRAPPSRFRYDDSGSEPAPPEIPLAPPEREWSRGIYHPAAEEPRPASPPPRDAGPENPVVTQPEAPAAPPSSPPPEPDPTPTPEPAPETPPSQPSPQPQPPPPCEGICIVLRL